MISIRPATSLDSDAVRRIHLAAFPESENQVVSALAVDLLAGASAPDTISLVAEADDMVVGHVAYSPVSIENNSGWTGYILAPLAVKPAYQKRQIGSKLIETGVAQLSKSGVNALFVYGDPKYYGLFGFDADRATPYLPPYELEFPFGWQVLILNEFVLSEPSVRLCCVDALSDPTLW